MRRRRTAACRKKLVGQEQVPLVRRGISRAKVPVPGSGSAPGTLAATVTSPSPAPTGSDSLTECRQWDFSSESARRTYTKQADAHKNVVAMPRRSGLSLGQEFWCEPPVEELASMGTKHSAGRWMVLLPAAFGLAAGEPDLRL